MFSPKIFILILAIQGLKEAFAMFDDTTPNSPDVLIFSTTTNSITVRIKLQEGDFSQIDGYILHYKPEFGDWETIDLKVMEAEFTIESLFCGAKYQIYAVAYNSIGLGALSEILHTQTLGSKPIPPANQKKFIEIASDSITFDLSQWEDGGCSITYFVVEQRTRVSHPRNYEWTLISNSVKPGGNFTVVHLEPDTPYIIRFTAHNEGGFAVEEYEITTLPMPGVKPRNNKLEFDCFSSGLSKDQQEILELTGELIEAINGADFGAYTTMVVPYLTSFEPEAMGNMVEGMEFHKFYFDNHLGKICHAMRTNILTPRVHLLGEDVAVIAYIRLSQCADRHGHAHSVPSEETRVWHKRDGQWQMVHFHRSYPK